MLKPIRWFSYGCGLLLLSCVLSGTFVGTFDNVLFLGELSQGSVND